MTGFWHASQYLFRRDTCKGVYVLCGDDYFCMDENAVEILSLCDGTRTAQDVIRVFSVKHPDDATLAQDVLGFLEEMKAHDVLRETPNPVPFTPFYPGDRPCGATLELTYRCNQHCSFCGVDAGREGLEATELEWEDYEPILEELGRCSPAPVNITGGEPLLRLDLVLRLARKARQLGLNPVLLTNGTLIDGPAAKALHDAGIHEAQVSIDSTRPEVHDTGRGVPGALEAARSGANALREAGVTVSGSAVITRRNIDHFEEIGAIIRGFADHSKFAEVYPLGRAYGSSELLGPEEILRVHLYATSTEDGKLAANLMPKEHCSLGTTPLITPYGDVFPCFMLRFPPFRLGNTRDRRLGEMWRDSRVLNELTSWRVGDIEGCRDCQNRLICGGGCRALAYAYHGTIYRPDPYHCRSSQLYTMELLRKGEPGTREAVLELLDIPALHRLDGATEGVG